MKRSLFFVCLMIFFISSNKAENPIISAIDTVKFPTLSIGIRTAEKLNPSDISITENKQNCNAKLNLNTGKKAVFYLNRIFGCYSHGKISESN